MHIIVTGANGFIGRRCIEKLLNRGHQVTAILHPSDIPHPLLTECKIVKLDLFNLSLDEIENVFSSSDALLHLAWQAGFNHFDPCHIKNVLMHYDFIEKVVKSGIKKVSVAGTMHEIGYHVGAVNAQTPCNPLNPYGVAKNFLRQALFVLAKSENFDLQWLRFYYITGDDEFNNSIFTKILKADASGEKTFPLNSGEMLYDFIDIQELAEKITLKIEGEGSGVFNCSSGKPVSLRTAVERFIADKNLSILPVYNVFPSREYDSVAIWGAC
ncbi:NAD-dependent epimerase/dehydratase family protein [Aeromonas veronii]|uniref:NAD-dependent epimerase/dehydratase family protein n=1 Tax=Aeromonas veronii TaxID=654 RepID=UPI003F79E4F1